MGFAPIGFVLVLLGWVLGLLVRGGRKTIVALSYPNGRRGVRPARYGTLRRLAAEDW